MAGAGRKVWTRETVSSADVNAYLMDQTVMLFASAAARTAAIPAPTEGMVTTLDKARGLERWSAAAGAWLAVSPALTTVTTPPDAAIATALAAGSTRGLHNAVTVTRPFGAGVPFQLFVFATCYATIQGASELALGAIGTPVTFRGGRAQNTSGTAENRSVWAFDVLSSGTADTVTFQPVLRSETGTSNPVADTRLTYSIALAIPQ